MPNLLLIKHARPHVLPHLPARDWPLSEEGKHSCISLARHMERYAPEVIVTSDEPKAVETGQLVAEALGRPCQTAPNLHEHDRSNVPYLSASDFIASVELFFRKADQLVLGRETAHQARQRFSEAVQTVLDSRPGQTVAIVAHGTVIALFVARYTAESGFRWWRRLQLPSLVVLSLPDFHHLQTIEKMGP